ncbi:copia protein isoform X2 [Neodiprion pinetum]|uniref:copia protein isoform X2 n=1 Tax=Neodiprion pinetum TaxID=441929 RepID=UPI00371BB7C8
MQEKREYVTLNNCPPYVHELNGTAERFNRTIMNMARCLLTEANVHKRFWPEIIMAATYLKNRTLTNTVERKTPYEIFFKKKPNIENLRVYGSKVFVKRPEQCRDSKFDKKAEMGVLLGYSDVGYRVLLNNRIIVARNVDIIEKDVKCIGIDYDDNDLNNKYDANEDENSDDDMLKDENELNKTIVESPEKDNLLELQLPLRPARERKIPVRYPLNSAHSIQVNSCRVDIPHTFEEAINSEEKESWVEAMNKEIESLDENGTWVLVNEKKDMKILDVKWVYTRKSNGSYKARLVVLGYQQTNVIDDIYAPVAKAQTMKILFSFCCQYGLIIEQLDVTTAFLNGLVSSEIHVRQPRGYEDGTKRICKLIEALYGLRESPRAWYECLDEYLTKLNFKRSEIDNCLYSHGVGENIMYVLVYVDDLLICCKTESKLKKTKVLLSERFKMKDLGEVKEYLGINIVYDYKRGDMKLSQEKYIESLACKYQLEGSRLYSTPMETNLKLEKANDCEPHIKYRNLIGELSHISTKTRPDAEHSVNYLSRYQNEYNETHWKYAMRVLKYLYLTKNLKLNYNRNKNSEIIDCFVDADWAGDIIDRKSTSGYVIRLFGNVIDWKSRKQKGVTKASTYAEYIALSEAKADHQ